MWSTCSHKWHVFAILFFFMSCPESPMGISSVGSFPVWSRGSLIIFQLFRCRNLALNRIFPTFLSGRHTFLYLGASGCPHMFVHPIHFYNPCPCVPHTPQCLCMLWKASACGGGCRGPLTYWTPPLHVGHLPNVVDASPYVLHPHSLVGFPACDMGNTPLMLRFGGAFPHMLGFGGISTSVKLWCLAVHPLGVHYALSCTFFEGHYVSCIYRAMTTTPLVMVMSSGLSSISLWPWPLPWWSFLQHWVSVKWFCCQPWCWDSLEVLLALPLCHSSNLHLQCLFWLMPIVL